MKVLGIMGSPRIGGNSEILLDLVLAGTGECARYSYSILSMQSELRLSG